MYLNSKFHYGHKPLSSIFILALLCIFAFGCLMIVIVGANIYKGITEDMDSNFEFRTPFSYISTKVRQNDDINSIKVVEKEGINALVLESIDGSDISETWIYEYKDSLYEVYITKGTEFNLQDGLAIIPSYGLDINMTGNLLQLRSQDHRGESRSLSITLRTDQGGEPL